MYFVCGSNIFSSMKFVFFSLQPSKLDLDVFIAIGQVDVDGGKYPSIAQWKKLVMSYSEATQQRLHFISVLNIFIDIGHFTFFYPFFFVHLPSL